MYSILDTTWDDTFARVDNIPDSFSPWSYKLRESVSLKDSWPSEPVFNFSRAFPEGTILCDLVSSQLGWLMASPRLQAILSEFLGDDVEMLPVTIVDHKGAVASKEYAIANLLVSIAAVDREQSEFYATRRGKIIGFDKLKLNEAILAPEPRIFRLQEKPMLVLCHQDVVSRCTEESLTGMDWLDADGYKTLDPNS